MTIAPLGKYYDTLPTSQHCTGDIWSCMPTYGLLKQSLLPGIVITPACDLANEKVETISYLPIIPIKTYLTSSAFWFEVRGTLFNIADQLDLPDIRALCMDISAIRQLDIDSLISQVNTPLIDKEKQKAQKRCLTALNYIKGITTDSSTAMSHSNLTNLFGQKAFDSMLTKIISNSFKNDIHFLPCDNQDPSWSVITHHSLVLFRYPLTVPIAIMDLAQSSTAEEWPRLIKTQCNRTAFDVPALPSRPLKGLRLRIEFLHDLLTRFVCLYTRLGSPDLTESTIATIKENL